MELTESAAVPAQDTVVRVKGMKQIFPVRYVLGRQVAYSRYNSLFCKRFSSCFNCFHMQDCLLLSTNCTVVSFATMVLESPCASICAPFCALRLFCKESASSRVWPTISGTRHRDPGAYPMIKQYSSRRWVDNRKAVLAGDVICCLYVSSRWYL